MKRKLSGYIMATVGFIMILADALSYIFSWELESPIFLILGVVFVIIGMRSYRKSKEKS